MSLFDSRFMPGRGRRWRAERNRLLLATPATVWELIEDPFAMPRWWPDVERVEGVEEDRFTQVFQTKRKRPVRMDFRVLASDAPGTGGEPPDTARGSRRCRALRSSGCSTSSITEVVLDPVHGGTTQITIAQAPEAPWLLADGRADAAPVDREAPRRGARRARADRRLT